MVAAHKDITTSPSRAKVIDNGPGRKPLPSIGELKPVIVDLIREVLSNPATWPGGLPSTPAFAFGPSTPPLDADALEERLVEAADPAGQCNCTDIEDAPPPGITEACETRFKRVLEMYDSIFSHRGIADSRAAGTRTPQSTRL